MPPALSVVIPTYDRPELLRRCLSCLMEQTARADAYEVLVVDDASATPVAPAVEPEFRDRKPVVRFLRVEHNNPSAARNLGLAEARGELVLFLGDDIFALPNLVADHLHIHREVAPTRPHPIAGLCRLATDPELSQDAFGRWFDPFGFDVLAGDQELSSRYFWTSNISASTELLRRHGGFDEEFPDANHEDIELGYRLERSGLRVYFLDRLVGHHHHPYTLDSAARLLYRRGVTYDILRRKVPDEPFRESLGIFSWRNHPRSVLRGLARELLFNDWVAPAWHSWLGRDRPSKVRQALYWKLLTHYTNAGYRHARRVQSQAS